MHEDGEVIKKITDIICKSGRVEDPSEVDTFWWKDFQTMFMNSFGESFGVLFFWTVPEQLLWTMGGGSSLCSSQLASPSFEHLLSELE